jgi:L-threonylcarbamoyladenylate synthase
MSARIFHIHPDRPAEAAEAIQAAAGALADGSLVILPTETVYGIAGRPDDPAVTDALFAAKRRPGRLSLPVLAATGPEALELTRTRPAAQRLASAFWPGPLTMVLRRSDISMAWELGEDRVTIGVRVPDHALAVALLRRTGPMAVTSANRSGRPPLADPRDLVAEFADRVEVYLLAGRAAVGEAASTVVDLTSAVPAILRAGPILAADVDRIVAGEGDRSPSWRRTDRLGPE